MKILIVDDHKSARIVLRSFVEQIDSVQIFEASDLSSAIKLLKASSVDVSLIDIRLGDNPDNRDGFKLIEICKEENVVPIVISVISEISNIRTAMKKGAYTYFLKDELCEELVIPVLKEIEKKRKTEQEVKNLRKIRFSSLNRLVGQSDRMHHLREQIKKVSFSNRPVLVTGPTGSGKELVVRAIHALGGNPDEPFIDLNCAAIPESLLESELFGYKKGAFSGAVKDYYGNLGNVRFGTLFLDEIAELSASLQAKLLRVLENGTYRQIGSNETRYFRGRVISATHTNLLKRINVGKFREDLYYRLNVLVIDVPSINERREDIPQLISHFAANQARPLKFSYKIMKKIINMKWTGNVREIRNFVDYLSVFSNSEEVTEDLIIEWEQRRKRREKSSQDYLTSFARNILDMDISDKIHAIECALIKEAIIISNNNKSAAAKLLGIHRKAVERRLTSITIL